MSESPEDAENPLRVLKMSPDMFRGRRGIVVLVMEAVGLVALNVLVWGSDGHRGPATQGHVPSTGPSLQAITAASVVATCLMVVSFISIWSWASPPPKDSKRYGVLAGLLMAGGIAAVVLRVMMR